jgi:hypothetical protein
MARRDAAGDFVQFLIGGCLFGAGGFLMANQVMVRSDVVWGRGAGMGFWGGSMMAMPWGSPGMGLLMLPLGIGVCLLFAGGFRRWANVLIWASLSALLVGVLNSVRMVFVPTTLWQLGVYIGMIAAGGGLMFRGLRAYDDRGLSRFESSNVDMDSLRRELEELKARLDQR